MVRKEEMRGNLNIPIANSRVRMFELLPMSKMCRTNLIEIDKPPGRIVTCNNVDIAC